MIRTEVQRQMMDVAGEVDRQIDLWGDRSGDAGKLGGDTLGTEAYGFPSADWLRYTCDRAQAEGRLTWGHVLVEEVGEALAETDDVEKLRGELVQVAAVVVSWLRAIDTRGETS